MLWPPKSSSWGGIPSSGSRCLRGPSGTCEAPEVRHANSTPCACRKYVDVRPLRRRVDPCRRQGPPAARNHGLIFTWFPIIAAGGAFCTAGRMARVALGNYWDPCSPRGSRDGLWLVSLTESPPGFGHYIDYILLWILTGRIRLLVTCSYNLAAWRSRSCRRSLEPRETPSIYEAHTSFSHVWLSARAFHRRSLRLHGEAPLGCTTRQGCPPRGR